MSTDVPIGEGSALGGAVAQGMCSAQGHGVVKITSGRCLVVLVGLYAGAKGEVHGGGVPSVRFLRCHAVQLRKGEEHEKWCPEASGDK